MIYIFLYLLIGFIITFLFHYYEDYTILFFDIIGGNPPDGISFLFWPFVILIAIGLLPGHLSNYIKSRKNG